MSEKPLTAAQLANAIKEEGEAATSEAFTVKLTSAQRLALTHGRLSDQWQSADQIGERIPTLDGLRSRGLVEMKRYAPLIHSRVDIGWRLTLAGRAVLDALASKPKP